MLRHRRYFLLLIKKKMKDIDARDFIAHANFKLAPRPTHLEWDLSDDEKDEMLSEIRSKLSKIQEKMYAHNRYGVLICLQGMDTSGKDSLIREVFKEMNPRGIVVHSFKTPTSKELKHDYLWRHYIALPESGKIAVFNRSHYENVIVTRVHPEYLLNGNLPGMEAVADIPEDFWERRFAQINNFEKHLAGNGTVVIKFYLNLSKEEQRQRLLRRLDEEKHNWKFSTGDLEERALWDKYMRYYEEAIQKTHSDNAPWYIIPADDKDTARVIAGSILLETLEQLRDIREPDLDEEVQKDIKKYRDFLQDEA